MKEQAHRKLNVGCGFDYRSGYVNVDLHERHNPDVVADVLELTAFPSGFYVELVAQDVLEHVTRENVRRALFEWNRVLRRGGKIFIRTTELGGLVRLLEAPENQAIEDQERLLQNVFGTQAYEGDFHLSGFTEPAFRFYMWEAGFEIDSLSLHHGAFLDAWATKVKDLGFEEGDLRPADGPFLQSNFRRLLGRPPSPAESSERGPRREVIRRLLLSDERRKALRSSAPAFPRTLHQPGLLRRVVRRAKRLTKSVLQGLKPTRTR